MANILTVVLVYCFATIKEANETKMREADSKKLALKTESARAVPVSKYASLDWLIR